MIIKVKMRYKPFFVFGCISGVSSHDSGSLSVDLQLVSGDQVSVQTAEHTPATYTFRNEFTAFTGHVISVEE